MNASPRPREWVAHSFDAPDQVERFQPGDWCVRKPLCVADHRDAPAASALAAPKNPGAADRLGAPDRGHAVAGSADQSPCLVAVSPYQSVVANLQPTLTLRVASDLTAPALPPANPVCIPNPTQSAV